MRIECEDTAPISDLYQVDKTGIGERHWNVTVFPHEVEHASPVIRQSTSAFDHAPRQVVTHLRNGPFAAPKEMASLGDDGFAGDQRQTYRLELLGCPSVMRLTRVECCDERTGIENDVPDQSPKPSKCREFVARSEMPLLKMPNPSLIRSNADSVS